jgi:hypothetical protein
MNQPFPSASAQAAPDRGSAVLFDLSRTEALDGVLKALRRRRSHFHDSRVRV